MFVTELEFELYRDTSMESVERAINHALDCLRYNGQIIGRELPVVINTQEGKFTARVICPETTSLHSNHHSVQVDLAFKQLSDVGLLSPKVKVIGKDMNSDPCDDNDTVPWQILYTSHLHTCSPIRHGDSFLPIPLYRLPSVANGDQKQFIKWQEDWSACDQLQMNGSVVEHPALNEMSATNSRLFQRGRNLCQRMTAISHIPTYLYLYRVGGESKEKEQNRPCPVCGGHWALSQPLHEVFDFKCDDCLLVSNLSWDFKD